MTIQERLDAARIEWERWTALHARNRVRSTADWHLYQRAMWTYEALLAEWKAAA